VGGAVVEQKEGGKGGNLKNLHAQAVVFVFLILSSVFISVRETKIVCCEWERRRIENKLYIKDEKRRKGKKECN